ncbi:MAG: NAD+ synthase [bacterium]|nr:NAD+ synthase [bacterium]
MTNLFMDIDYSLVRKILVHFLRNEIGRTGLKHGIIGLSGGLDSALVAWLAVEALGAENISCVAMPYKSSSPESLAHAKLVAGELGVGLTEVEITPMVDAYFDNRPTADSLRRGNKMARERMSVLYDLSAERSALVLGTSNRSEILLGYGTAFGDLACAVNPIGELFKTQVRILSRLLGVPAVVIDKAPSADLWAGQSDEQELGFTYETVDPLLYLMFNRQLGRQGCIDAGFEAAFVDRVAELNRCSEFKRRLPLIAGLSMDFAASCSGASE